jgi:hypothetical protein
VASNAKTRSWEAPVSAPSVLLRRGRPSHLVIALGLCSSLLWPPSTESQPQVSPPCNKTARWLRPSSPNVFPLPYLQASVSSPPHHSHSLPRTLSLIRMKSTTFLTMISVALGTVAARTCDKRATASAYQQCGGIGYCTLYTPLHLGTVSDLYHGLAGAKVCDSGNSLSPTLLSSFRVLMLLRCSLCLHECESHMLPMFIHNR